MSRLNESGSSNADDLAKLYAVAIEDYDESYTREGIGNSMVSLAHATLGNPNFYGNGDDEPEIDSLKPLVFRRGQYDKAMVEDALVLVWRASGIEAELFLEEFVAELNSEDDARHLKFLKKILIVSREMTT